MSYARPKIEDEFIISYLSKEIRALAVDVDMRKKFLDFAIKQGGADEKKFPARLYHVIKGRTPSAYIALLIVKFFTERLYEDFIRTKKDCVEYITSDGDISKLEEFVSSHPLMLRIVRVRLTNWVITGRPNGVGICLRSPVKDFNGDEMDYETVNATFDQRMEDFRKWIEAQPDLPISYLLPDGESVDVSYLPDWLRNGDETGFEDESDLGGDVDIGHGTRIMLLAASGSTSPLERGGMETFYNLDDIFRGTEAKPAPRELSFANYWPRIIAEKSGLPDIFFSRLEWYPTEVRCQLEPFFKHFAESHEAWTERAKKDGIARSLNEQTSDSYHPDAEQALHYAEVTKTFLESLEPVLEKCWDSFAKTSLKILDVERIKANKSFARMKMALEREK